MSINASEMNRYTAKCFLLIISRLICEAKCSFHVTERIAFSNQRRRDNFHRIDHYVVADKHFVR